MNFRRQQRQQASEEGHHPLRVVDQMQVVYDDQKRLVRFEQFVDDVLDDERHVVNADLSAEALNRLLAEAGARRGDARAEVSEEDWKLRVGRVEFVPGDAPPAAPREVRGEQSLSRARAPVNDRGVTAFETLAERGEQSLARDARQLYRRHNLFGDDLHHVSSSVPST